VVTKGFESPRLELFEQRHRVRAVRDTASKPGWEGSHFAEGIVGIESLVCSTDCCRKNQRCLKANDLLEPRGSSATSQL
jgi:hypothetical protein